MSRNEVLEHVQTLAEVRGDGRLDDFSRRLGHQPAHARELPDLLLGAARAGVRHNVDRVKLRRLVLGLHGLEHLVGDLVRHLRPDGDHLVVALAVSDDAVLILLFNLDDFLFRLFHQARLALRNQEVVDADGDAGLGGGQETERLDFVQQLDRGLETEAQVAVVAQGPQSLLPEQTVDEGHFFGQVIVENHAAHGGADELVLDRDRFRVKHVLVVVSGA